MEDAENEKRQKTRAKEDAEEESASRAISMHYRGRIGFNIKRFYEPNKKAINRLRFNRGNRQMMYRVVHSLTYNKRLPRER